ncbi:MAG: hypothetical protein NTU98_02735 [Bacteroidetes bacterium]|nr:hypothetical protein [Bacteroidota bacterium]
MKKFVLLNIFIACIIPAVFSQYFSTGQDPASIRWRQIKTKKFQLIYPSTFEKNSRYLANILDMVAVAETTTLTAKVPRIPVVIHSSSSESNGITVWAPKRIELYPCPPQNIYAEEWLEQLAIHEYRHAVQISKMNQGFTRVLSWILGEQATGGVLGLYIPTWFLEGDATCTETALSNSGRGRTSSFESILRAQLLEKKIYSYDKAVLGSYRTFVPDQYELGYPLVAQARKTYGSEMWNRPIDRAAKIPVMVVPFASGIKKETGLSKVRFYKKMLTDLTSDWKKQEEAVSYTDFTPVTKRNPKNYSTYLHPVALNDSLIIAEKECMDDPDRFMQINRKTGKEKKILTMGPASDESISVTGNYLVWSEYQPDPRWNNRSYSVIRLHDFSNHTTRNLTSRTRYFAPFLSPDGGRIAAIRISTENQCSIDILETTSGKILKTYPMERNVMALTPNWSPDGSCIVFVILTEKGKSIACLHLETGKTTYLLPFGFTEVSGPAFFHNHHLFFTSDYSGISNIYSLDTATRQIYQVTSARFLAADPDFQENRNRMIYSDYSSDGLMIVTSGIDTTKWIPLGKIADNSIRLYEPLVRQENTNIQDSVTIRKISALFQNDSAGKAYPSKKYSKLLHMFNPHSWEPASVDINNQTFRPGVAVHSQDVLNTMIASAGWEYNTDEAVGKFFANFSYQGLYPVFDIGFSAGNRSYTYWLSETDGPYRFTWQELNFKFHASIPWNFSRGKYSRFLTPSIGTTLISLRHTASTPEQLTKGNIISMDYQLTFSQYLNSSARDMYPRLGQTLQVNFRNTPFSGNSMGSIFAAQTNLYFPGIFRHQGIKIYGGYQEQHTNEDVFYTFEGIIDYPRGYSGAWDEQVLSLALNYKLPLFCPDFSAGSVAYFKRFKLNLFFDWAQGATGDKLNIYQSTGAELTTDLHLLRFLYPFEMGVRMTYFPSSATFGWEFLYGISF